jgi:hypothetical protein
MGRRFLEAATVEQLLRRFYRVVLGKPVHLVDGLVAKALRDLNELEEMWVGLCHAPCCQEDCVE